MMKKQTYTKHDRRDRYFVPLLILITLDLAIFAFSFLLAYSLRFYTGVYEWVPPPPPPYIPDYHSYILVAISIGLIGIIVFERIGLYERRIGLDRQTQSGSLILAVLVSYIFLMALLFNYRDFSYSRLTIGLAIPFTCIGMLIEQYALKRIQMLLVKKGVVFFKTIFVGPLKECIRMNHKLQKHHGSKYQLLGYVTSEKHLEPSQPLLPCLGTLSDLPSLIEKSQIDNVIITMPANDIQSIKQVLDVCVSNHINYRLPAKLFEHLYQKFSINDIPGLPIILFDETPMSGFGKFLKRFMDVLIAGITLIITSPIMLFTAILIKIDSRGPIFYVQERVGSDGSKFYIYKFRSMVDNAENGTGPKWATANDPRTTGIGRFLRRYNLDELPQFLNVLRGEMSLVGPRPERPYFVDQFKEQIPHYMRRHIVKTGITGWAQINGWRGDTSLTERIEHDIYYVENWSILFDLKILWKTLTSFKNAY